MLPIAVVVRRTVILSSYALSLCVLVPGCGDPGIGAIPVEGTVLVDKKPMEGVMVVFHPDPPGGRAASGKTDANGVYKLTTEINGDGALAGSYKIAVSKHVNAEDDLPKEVDPNDPASLDAIYSKVDTRKRQESKNFIGKRWENHLGSGLTATVERGKENKFNLEVTSK
jgi:hypothetical protein